MKSVLSSYFGFKKKRNKLEGVIIVSVSVMDMSPPMEREQIQGEKKRNEKGREESALWPNKRKKGKDTKMNALNCKAVVV